MSSGTPSRSGQEPPRAQSPLTRASALKGSVNPVYVWLNVSLGALGCVSTILPYVNDGVDSVNGWDSARMLGELGEFSMGTLLILLLSVSILVAGASHFSDLGKRQTPKSQGVGSIILGVVLFWNANQTYWAWDSVSKDGGFSAYADIGLIIPHAISVALVIIGILCLSVRNFHTRGDQ